MPARYTERQAADRGAVARYYQKQGTMYRLVTLFAPVLAMSEYDILLPMPSGQEPVD